MHDEAVAGSNKNINEINSTFYNCFGRKSYSDIITIGKHKLDQLLIQDAGAV